MQLSQVVRTKIVNYSSLLQHEICGRRTASGASFLPLRTLHYLASKEHVLNTKLLLQVICCSRLKYNNIERTFRFVKSVANYDWLPNNFVISQALPTVAQAIETSASFMRGRIVQRTRIHCAYSCKVEDV